jgi:tetratricopeptide (TPR) repeat protein
MRRSTERRIARTRRIAGLGLAVLLTAGAAGAAQEDQALDLVKRGRTLERDGRFDESLALYRKAVTVAPALFDARFALGRSLDLAGEYAEARTELEAALNLADPSARDMVLSALAISYAFEGRASDAARYYRRQFDAQLAAGQIDTAAATANAMARVYLESGLVDEAEQWYRKGYDTALRTPDLTAAQKDLWEFRWENAAGRIAARRGRLDEARAATARAEAVLARGTNEDQRQFLPYLRGYVAFHAGDYRAAVRELEQGNLDDPFVAGMLAQAYDKLGDSAKARELFQRVMASSAHSINAAFSRPAARASLSR